MLGYAMCGSFCTLKKSIEVLEMLIKSGYEVQPIMSEIVYSTDTRFWKSNELKSRVEALTGKEIIHTIVDAEPIGPKSYMDLLIVAPCTGNSLAKLANGITDTSVTMAMKAQLRANKPVLIALASNDALSSNLQNIAKLKTREHVFFSEMQKDDPAGKPHSLVAKFEDIPDFVNTILEQYNFSK